MADSVTIDTTEVAALAVTLANAGPFAVAEAGEIIEDGANLVVAIAKTYVPVKTGATRDSIDYTMVNRLEAEAGPTTPYAPFIEYGTVGRAPRAFMGPALDIAADQVVAALETLEIPGIAGGLSSIVLGATVSSKQYAGARGGAPGLSSGPFG